MLDKVILRSGGNIEPESVNSASETVSEISYQDKVVQELELNNHLLVGIIFFLGVLMGILGVTIFFNRFKGE